MLIGHKSIFDKLKADARAGRLQHAQLFVGPEHVGKSKIALKLAMEMQCPNESEIVTRKLIASGADSDTLLFFDDGEVLPIENIRGIVSRSDLTHVRPYFIVVIENIGRMKVESMNALLKTLEEPPDGTVFFLTANREEDILPTIKSRCQISYFHTVGDSVLLEACADKPFARELVMFAMGRPGKLMRLIDDNEYFQAHKEMHSLIKYFLEAPSISSMFELIRLLEKSELSHEMLDILLHRIRTLALTGGRGQNSPALEHMDFTVIMDNIERTKQDLGKNVNKRLLLENLLIPFTA